MTILSRLFTPSQRPAPAAQNDRFEIPESIGKAAQKLRKYQDIPLNLHRQWLLTFLTSLLLIGVVSGIYLNLTANTAIAGREIQALEAKITENQRINADLQTNIAEILSSKELQARAVAAGYAPLTRENITYLVVPGYVAPSGPDLLKPAVADNSSKMPAEYTETLLTWIARQLDAASTPLAHTSQ